MAATATSADSLLKSGEVSSVIRQGFIVSPRVSPSSSPPSLSTAVGGGNGAPTTQSLPSPPASSFSSPKSASLFEMIAQEDLSRRHQQLPPSGEKLRRLHESVSAALAREGPGDVQLAVSSADGTRLSFAAHHRVLAARSRFFAEKLAGVDGATPGRPVAVEICECDDVESYLEAVGMMYSVDLRPRIACDKVDKILGLLRVSVVIMFDDGISSCLDYLDMMPWSETKEEKVISVLRKPQLQPHELILQRVSVEPSNCSYAHSIFFRIMASILQAKDKKARREMKSLIAGLLKEDQNKSVTNDNKLEVSREAGTLPFLP